MTHATISGKLHMISMLKEGQTISTVNESIIKRDCTYRTYLRFMYKEDRWKVFEWIKKSIEDAFTCIKDINTEEMDIIKLKKCLEQTLEGLEQLKKTYQDDPTLQRDIKHLQEEIERQLAPTNDSKKLYSHFSSTALRAIDIPYQTYKSKCHTFLSQSYPNDDLFPDKKNMENMD